jgi:predicted esterase
MKYEWGGQMRDTLVNLGMNVDFHSYEGLAHWWNDNEMSDVVKFLEKNWDG